MNAKKIGGDVSPFSDFRHFPFDYYGTAQDPMVNRIVDQPIDVARARAFTMSLMLSGTSRILFADPWVFIDGFHRLRDAFDAIGEKLTAAGLERGPEWKAPDPTVAFLEPYAHWNHWHAQWSLPPGSRQTVPGPDFARWVPVWRALGVEIEELDNFLAQLLGTVAHDLRGPIQEVKALVDELWAGPSLGVEIDFFQFAYGGPSRDQRWLLENTNHAAEY